MPFLGQSSHQCLVGWGICSTRMTPTATPLTQLVRRHAKLQRGNAKAAKCACDYCETVLFHLEESNLLQPCPSCLKTRLSWRHTEGKQTNMDRPWSWNRHKWPHGDPIAKMGISMQNMWMALGDKLLKFTNCHHKKGDQAGWRVT